MAVRRFICTECSTPFDASRSDAETCSTACRARRYRRERDARRAAREAALVEESRRAATLLAAISSALAPAED